jgi:two-component system LytT family sensor kinase
MTGSAASLINLLGFITGLVLYVMLLWIVLISRPASNRLTLLTGILGFIWNAGAFSGYGLINLGFAQSAPLLLAGAFAALGFLPSVVVHTALRTVEQIGRRQGLAVAGAAYAMGSIAAVMHFHSAITAGPPSNWALRGITYGFAGLLLALLVITRHQKGRGRVLWVVAMSVFAVSALHLSNHEFGQDPWWLQLAGHHASLPLVLLILYQDFRFAFADIFLKRALSFIFLAALIFGMFAFAVLDILNEKPTSERSVALLLTLWALTALLYPFLRRGAEWLIDKVVLRRADYTLLITRLSNALERCETPSGVLDETIRALSPALSAQSIEWTECAIGNSHNSIEQDRRSARITILPVDAPHYVLNIHDLTGGRRLLSDDVALLERVALLAAHRIDAVRSNRERYQRDVREQEMRKLAAEAELRALRAQINPHFLFNALTTIGYLIQTAPERALGTLLRLSGLLRGVLKSGEEFVTIGEELDLIEAYLDIERARFEDRLRVHIDVPWELRRLRIPALVIQPLVENAIKHGISECLSGGEVRITARLQQSDRNPEQPAVLISVVDTGVGVAETTLAHRRGRGLGLSNVEQRLQRCGNNVTPLLIRSAPGSGTTVEIQVPLQPREPVDIMDSVKSS